MSFLNEAFRQRTVAKFNIPLERLHLSRDDFNPAEFENDKNNKKRIISYKPSGLFHYGFVNPKGSTFNIGVAVRTLIMCGAATFAANFTCPTKQTKPYSFCFPVVAASEGLIFAGLVSFLLGLFISTTFSRWWSMREKLGTVMNNTVTLTMLLNNFCPKDNPELVATKTRVLRLMHLAHAVIYKQANNDSDLSDLVDSKMATQAEADALFESRTTSQPAVIYGWIMTLLQPILPKLAPAATISSCVTCVSNCLNSSQEISAFLKTQMPYAYLHLLAFTTKVHLAFVIFYSAGVIAQGIQQTLWTRIMLGYTIMITNNIIYEGLLRVHEMLYNPLGDDNADFPSHLYVASTVALTTALEHPPPKEEEDASKGKERDLDVRVYG